MAKERFIYGYPIFTGMMLLILGLVLGIGLFVEAINSDWVAFNQTLNHIANPTTFIQVLAPLIFGFPLTLTALFIMMGTTWEDWEKDYQ